MYKLFTMEDKVRVPPQYFTMKLNEAVHQILIEKYERMLDKDMGIIVAVSNANVKSEGIIIPGDGAAYYDVEYQVLCFKPEVNEVFKGDVTEVLDFGILVRMGPVEGLAHLSQITNDFMVYNRRIPALVGKDTNKSIRKGDIVYAKISTVGMKSNIQNVKIGLTMRPLGLGKLEWVEAHDKNKSKSGSKGQNKGQTKIKEGKGHGKHKDKTKKSTKKRKAKE